MTTASSDLPQGLAGLQYPITQVSLAVRDLEQTMERYWRAFGWSGWDVFDHKPPMHHNTELRGERVDYRLKGAEVMVGSLNFELLEPVDGPSLWKEFIDERGEGVASIAVMFKTLEEGEAVKREFAARGMPVTMKANIGDHIEYYYLDTQDQFGCLIESGSGHAADFVRPAYIYPTAGRAADRQARGPRLRDHPDLSRRTRPRRADARLPRGFRLGAVEDLRVRRQDGHARLRARRPAGRLLQHPVGGNTGWRSQLRADRAAERRQSLAADARHEGRGDRLDRGHVQASRGVTRGEAISSRRWASGSGPRPGSATTSSGTTSTPSRASSA